MQVDEAYCACAPPWAGGGWAPLREAQALQEAVQEAESQSPGLHLPPSRLQLRPVSFRNVSLKRSPTPGFPRNT